MERDEWFGPKFRLLKKFAIISAVGFLPLIFCLVTTNAVLRGLSIAIVFIGITPLIFWLAFIPVMHWRERYKGSRPNIWGAFLVFETSGWSKVLYWFLHVLPDKNGSGIYADTR